MTKVFTKEQAVELVQAKGYTVVSSDRTGHLSGYMSLPIDDSGPKAMVHFAYWIRYGTETPADYSIQIDAGCFAPIPGTHSSSFPMFLDGELTDLPTPEQAFELAKADYPNQYEAELKLRDEMDAE